MGQFLILDLDETLIANSFRFAHPSPKIKVVTLPNDFGYMDQFIVRPFVEDFLYWCREHFEHVLLATFSPEQRAAAVLDSVGLRQYFDLIVARHVLDESKGLLLLGGEPEKSYDFGGDFCLIDDQDWDANHTLIKMNFFGIDVRPVVDARKAENPLEYFAPIADHLIQAPAYEGDPEDDFFLRLLEAFKANYFPEEKLTA